MALVGKACIAFLLLVADFHWLAAAAPQKVGRFFNPQDCGSYIDVVLTPLGVLEERVKPCYGNAFSVEENECVELSRIPSCTPRLPNLRNVQVPVPELSYMCQEGSGSKCHDCKMAVNCVGNDAYPTACKADEICDVNPLFQGAALCLPNTEDLGISSECLCSDTAVEIKPDPFNSSMYLACSLDNAGIPDVKYCGEEKTYDAATKTCQSEGDDTCGPSPPFPDCATIGTFVHPENCSWGYSCFYSNGDWEVIPECCLNADDVFNPATGKCESACTVLSKPYTVCDAEGIVIDPNDCTKYYACAKSGSPPTQSYTCPNGKQYSTDDDACTAECDRKALAHCVLPESC